jgi:type II secretory pathway pseudopilin PulG
MREQNKSKGYALLMVCFLVALMVIGTAAAVPNLLTEGRRAREAEMIWRGEQYARAVRLYYRKNGRFPQSIEQLTEPQGKLRFLRKAYADPMNHTDGSWRMIYVGPNGELIGSVKSASMFGRPAGSGSTFGQPPQQGTSQRPSGSSQTPSSTGKASGPEGRVFGGNIIGVGSKMGQDSILVYKGGTNYRDWEFIWDPTAEGMIIGPAGSRPGVPPGKAPPPGTTPPRQ